MTPDAAAPGMTALLRPRLALARRRMLWIALAASAGLHVLLVLALTGWLERAPVPAPPGATTVELIMQDTPAVHYGGSPGAAPPSTPPIPPTPTPPVPTPPIPTPPIPTPPIPTPPSPQSVPAPPTPPAPRPPAAPAPTAALPDVPLPPPPPPTAPAHAAVPMPPPPRAKPTTREATSNASAETAPAEPQAARAGAADVNLGNDPAVSMGLAAGEGVVPAAPDAKFRNIPPRYPLEAQLRSEEGAVGLLIHVSPAGNASGVDVVESSGYPVLDRAAREAVLRWHFHPEQKDGIPVASDFPFRIIFGLDKR